MFSEVLWLLLYIFSTRQDEHMHMCLFLNVLFFQSWFPLPKKKEEKKSSFVPVIQ